MSKIRIVLAEDHHMVRAAVAALLAKEADIDVIGEIADGYNLVAQVADLKPDVLVLDAKMPGQKVITAVQEIKENFPEIKILVLSAHNRREYVVGVFREGAAGYVLKDDAPEVLAQAIRTVFHGKEWISPRVTSQIIHASTKSPQLDQLTPREIEVLRQMTLGKKNDEIATDMVISQQTVKNYIRNIFSKLDFENRVDAVLFGIKHGLAENTLNDDDV